MRLLSIDWDFFFPIPADDPHCLYDWGHREDMAFMREAIWIIRAGAFLRDGGLPGLTGEQDSFWQRFRRPFRGAALYYSDSHAHIFKPEVRAGVTEVWNFDAHHDSYKPPAHVIKQGSVSCEDWATAFTMIGVPVKTFYPTWNAYSLAGENPKAPMMPAVQLDPGVKFNRQFDKVFICRSGAWTPTWLEDAFWRFLETCPVGSARVNLDGIQRRTFDLEEARRMQAQVEETMNEARLRAKEVKHGEGTGS